MGRTAGVDLSRRSETADNGTASPAFEQADDFPYGPNSVAVALDGSSWNMLPFADIMPALDEVDRACKR